MMMMTATATATAIRRTRAMRFLTQRLGAGTEGQVAAAKAAAAATAWPLCEEVLLLDSTLMGKGPAHSHPHENTTTQKVTPTTDAPAPQRSSRFNTDSQGEPTLVDPTSALCEYFSS
mmetsp:Transcript_79632/g.165424  ORF Transcript_79632/g.165424 Transcript_79632/m.165424 type:complete len:117 (-) Transcript_79632:161-511(-)